MKLSVGADGRFPVVDSVWKYLEQQGHELTWYGPESLEAGFQPYPDIARQVAQDVASGKADEGILFCWTGTGVTMAANKVPGVRAALCDDAETAKGARWWNNANTLCLSMRRTSEVIAREILAAWFSEKYDPQAEKSITDAVDMLMDMDRPDQKQPWKK